MSITGATGEFRSKMSEWRVSPSKEGDTTGLPDLDDLVKFNPGDVITLAARTSVGKTSVLMAMIEGICRQQVEDGDDRTVGFISAEMPAWRLVQRFVAAGLNTTSRDLMALPQSDIDAYLAEIERWPLEIFDARSPALPRLDAWLKRLRRPSVVFLDHLGKVQVPNVYEIYPKTSRVADATSGWANDYKCTVVQAAQVNRNVESRISHDREGKLDVSLTRPMPSDIEGSGKIEQNSDVCIMLWREEYYRAQHEQRAAETGPMEFNVCKNRNGATGFVRMTFAPHLATLLIPRKPLVVTAKTSAAVTTQVRGVLKNARKKQTETDLSAGA